MKKLFLVGTALLSGLTCASTFAINPFTTLQQAQDHCPPTNDLTFTQKNPIVPNGAGTIAGSKNSVPFSNYSVDGDPYVMHPQQLDSQGVVGGVAFRQVNISGSGLVYGYVSGNKTTCFYLYPGFTGISVNLLMQSN